MKRQILVINPGSTSTKVAVFLNERVLCQQTISHSPQELGSGDIMSQEPLRRAAVERFLSENDVELRQLCAVVGRGGILPPVRSGAYLVDDALLDILRNHPREQHASNLGGVLAAEFARSLDIPAYIYDSIAVDEMAEGTHLSGCPQLPRVCHFHALNSRAMAIAFARARGLRYEDMNLIVAHMGGGISTSAHCRGRVIDVFVDDEGTFSPQRSGRVQSKRLVRMCYSGQYDCGQMLKLLSAQSGLLGYLGTNDAQEVERRIEQGDAYAEMVYREMAAQIAKDIGGLATAMDGKVDNIILTGGLANSDMLTGWLEQRVSWIAPVAILPGEMEMEALAAGAYRVLDGEEEVRVFGE